MHATDVSGECGRANARRARSPRWFALSLFLLAWPWTPAAAHDQLTIGIVQFPPALNPDLEAVAAKSYVLGFALRPFTTFDANWKLVCLLCTELPTFENGRAVKTELPGGKTGVEIGRAHV